MRILRAQVWKEDLTLRRPYTIAYRHIDRAENVFFVLVLEGGRLGIGAAAPAKEVTGESLGACEEALRDLAETATGKDVRRFMDLIREAERSYPARPAARAAHDMALHDAFCQGIDLPLAHFLGAAHRSLPTSVTLGIGPAEEAVREGREFLRQGFRALKLKIGNDRRADLETCRALRTDLGRAFALRVDANQGYSAEDLTAFHRESADLDLELIEQPLPQAEIEAMRRLPEDLRRRCAADEALQGPADALAFACRPRPFGIFNIKLMKCGGIHAARELAAIGHRAGIDLMWGCNDESAASIGAALHVALASPATRYLDLDGSFDLARDVVDGGFTLRDGALSLPPGPGLGVTLRAEFAQKV